MKKKSFRRIKRLCGWTSAASLTAGALTGIIACGEADNVANDEQVQEVKQILNQEFAGQTLAFTIPSDYKNIENVKKSVNNGLSKNINDKLNANAAFKALPFKPSLEDTLSEDVQLQISNLISDGLNEVSSEGTFELFSKGQDFTINFNLIRGVRIIHHQVKVVLKPTWAKELINEKLGGVLDGFYDYLNGQVENITQLNDAATKVLPISTVDGQDNNLNDNVKVAINSYWNDYLSKNRYEQNLIDYLKESSSNSLAEPELIISTYPELNNPHLKFSLKLGDNVSKLPEFAKPGPGDENKQREARVAFIDAKTFKSTSEDDKESFSNKLTGVFNDFKNAGMVSFWTGDEMPTHDKIIENFVKPQTEAILDYLNSSSYGNLIDIGDIKYDENNKYDPASDKNTVEMATSYVKFLAPGQDPVSINDFTFSYDFPSLPAPAEDSYSDVMHELDLTGASWIDTDNSSLVNINTDGSYLIGSKEIKVSPHGSVDLNKQLLKINDRRSVFIRDKIATNKAMQRYHVGNGPNTNSETSNSDYSDVSFTGNYKLTGDPNSPQIPGLHYDIKNSTDKMNVSFNNNLNTDNTWFEDAFWPALEDAGLGEDLRDDLQAILNKNDTPGEARPTLTGNSKTTLTFKSFKDIANNTKAALNYLIANLSKDDDVKNRIYNSGVTFTFKDSKNQKIEIGFNPLAQFEKEVYKAIDYIKFDNLDSSATDTVDWSWALDDTLSDLEEQIMPDALQPL